MSELGDWDDVANALAEAREEIDSLVQERAEARAAVVELLNCSRDVFYFPDEIREVERTMRIRYLGWDGWANVAPPAGDSQSPGAATTAGAGDFDGSPNRAT